MKNKLISFVLLTVLIFSVFALSSCTEPSSSNQFTELKDSEFLKVGSVNSLFMNSETEIENINTLQYLISVTYTLRKTTYSSGDYVYYEGYYYYWSEDAKYETEELGKVTTQKVVNYSYLPYRENESVLVLTKTVTKTSYDYKGGWVEKNVDVNTNLGGYFTSFDDLTEKCPELAAKIDISKTRKYYVDVTTPDAINYEERFYDSYYYIEKK